MTMKTQTIQLTAKEVGRESRVFYAGTTHEIIVEQRSYEGGGLLLVIIRPDGFIFISNTPPEGGDSVRPAPGGEDKPNPPPLPGKPS